MEIRYTPVTHEAFLRSLQGIEQTSKAPTGPPISLTTVPQMSPTSTESSNPINWIEIIVGALVVAGACYIVYDLFQEDKRKD